MRGNLHSRLSYWLVKKEKAPATEKFDLKVDELIKEYVDNMSVNKRGKYFNVTKWRLGKPHYISLHRLIMGAKENEVVDHINGDPSDNRVENLRITTSSGNSYNRKVHREGKLPGISKDNNPKRRKKWRAERTINGKVLRSCYYLTPEEAYQAWKELGGAYQR